MRNKFLAIISSSIFLLLPLFFTSQVSAASGPPLIFTGWTNPLQPKTIYDYGKEFCDKRSGDLMNLETWYSGKCAPGVDTLSGDGVGFSDIIVLQGFEAFIGPQYDTFVDMVIKSIKALADFKIALLEGQSPQSIPQYAELTKGGFISSLATTTTQLMTTKPASTIDYLAYVSSNLREKNIVQDTYAATPGYGFTALAPILPIWRAFRNITYVLFALAFVLYGVMIMLRVRIDSKTAATVQLAIPKLIATLLLITFSYSIVGFLVDLSTVATYLSINVLRLGGILTPVNFHILVDVVGGLSLGAVGSWFVNGILAALVSPFILFNLLIGGATGVMLAGLLFVGTIWNIGAIVSLAIMIAVAYAYIKLIFKLFEAFFSVIVSLIFAPIAILGNILPGSNSFSTWIMSVIGNLSVFPVASFFLVLSYALMVQPILNIDAMVPSVFSAISGFNLEDILGVKNLSTLSSIWTPPMTIPQLSQSTGPLIGSSVGSLMLATIGFGLLLMASKYVDMVKDTLKVPPFKYGAAIGEALSVPGKVGGAVLNTAEKIYDKATKLIP